MKLFKKLNKYLLENYPLTWHSKVIQLTLAGVLFWAISFCFGFGLMNLNVLKHDNISTFYFESYFVLFHVIYCVIVLSLWALFFYKNNAFKSYYPLQKGYLTKLFFHLFVPFLILVSAIIPFRMGSNVKAATYFNKDEIQKEVDILNIGNAFLVIDSARYELEHRSYPSIYPIDYVKYDDYNDKWEGEKIKIQISNKPSFSKKSMEELDVNNEYSFLINGRKNLFYKTRTVEYKYSKCYTNHVSVFDRFFKESELDQPQYSSILNFSDVLIEDFGPSSSSFFNFNFESDDENINALFTKQYSPLIYSYVRNKEFSKIKQSIDDFKAVCDKYEISYRLNSNNIVTYLKCKDFKDLYSITNSYRDYYNVYHHKDEIQALKNSLTNEELVLNIENQHVYYFNESALKNVYQNYFKLNDSIVHFDVIFMFLFLALGLTWMFFGFEFFSIKNVLISIPVAGVIIILNFVFVLLFYSFRNADDDNFWLSFLSTFLLIFVLTIFGIKSKKINKKIINILFTLCYMIVPLFISFLAIYYNELTKKVEVFDKCRETFHTETHNSFLIEPFFFFFYALVGILLFIPFLKKWKALEE